MTDPDTQPRLWRHDEGALFAGVCSGLAEDLDLPLPLVRFVSLLFVFLPTGLAYLALGILLRRRPALRGAYGARPSGQRFAEPPASAARASASPRSFGAAGQDSRSQGFRNPGPAAQDWALLRHRFAALEPRITRIEGVVTADDFELQRDFRRMEP